MKKYWVAFKLEFQSFLEYRADLVVYTLSNSMSAMVGLAIWLAVSSSQVKLAYSRNQLIEYFILAALVEIMTVAWWRFSIARGIDNGEFARFQIKPVSLLGLDLAQNLSEKFYQLVVVGLLMSGLVWQLSRTLGFSFDVQPLALVLAVVSVLLALMISIFIDLLIGLSFIWLHDIAFLSDLDDLLKSLLSGAIIPLIFLPAWLKTASVLLPFRYLLSFPIEVFLNRLSSLDLAIGFGIQFGWALVFWGLYRFIYKRGLKVYQGYGV